MRVRHIKTGEIGSSHEFNIHAMCKILVYFNDWMDTDYPSEYEFYIEALDKWVKWDEARKRKYIITDNYNERFYESFKFPKAIRKRGYV